ncbi:ATP-grasp domain-containing protein [bacterium]|nr:ATP-grasp domain-containing protein [bacterium]
MDNIENDINGTSALITDIDRRKAIPIIRALGRSGVRVIGISYKRLPLGAFSKYCSKAYRCPDYRDKPDLFMNALERICRDENPDVFYPIEDVAISLCLQNPNAWTPYTKAVLPSQGIFEKSYDKWETIKFARQQGIRVPETYCPKNIEEVKRLAESWKGQAVIKPRKSSGSRGLRYAENSSQMLSAYKEVANKYPRPLVQERIPLGGQGLGVFTLLNWQNELLSVFGHKRLREYPVSGGPSTLRISYRNQKLLEQTVRLFKEMRLVGVAMAEYKTDLRNNEPVLMEINARFWGSLQLAIASGVNFPVLYHKLALGKNFKPVLDYPVGKLCRWLWPGDLLHFLNNPKRFDNMSDFFQFRDPNMSYDILSYDDILPALGILLEALRKLPEKIFKRQS